MNLHCWCIPMADSDILLTTLSEHDWQVVRRRQQEDLLPEEVRQRYPRLPADVESFLGGLELCTNRQRTVWFLTGDDYRRHQEGQFRWNEHELMSLDAADDPDEKARIRAYWDCHFPLMFAVHSDYDYLAIDLQPSVFGQIVHGYMPEPEESTPVANSFAEFRDLLIHALTGEATYPLRLFL